MDWRRLIGRLVLYLIILAVGTYVIGFILNVVAIWIPPAASYVFCPEGTTIVYSWTQTSYDEPGQKSLGGTCVDAQGKNHPKLPDEVVTPREYQLFMPLGFAIMIFILGWRYALGLFKRKDTPDAQPTGS